LLGVKSKMDLLSKISETIGKLAIPPVIKSAQKNEHVIRILQQFNFNPTHPPSDFDSLYAYTMVTYGVFKPKDLLDFFRNNTVKEAFRDAYDSNNSSLFLNEAQSRIDWSVIETIINKSEYDPRREYASFSAIFNEIVDRSRTPAEVRRDLKIDSIHGDLHKQTTLILDQLSKLDNIDAIWSQIAQIENNRNSQRFMLTPKDSKLKVYISSNSSEFRDLQEILVKALEDRDINAWVFAGNNLATPNSVFETSIKQVEASDVYIGLFGSKYSELAEKELLYARQTNKPCFVFIREVNGDRDPELSLLLQTEVLDSNKGLTYSYFESALTLGDKVAQSVMSWLFQKHREMTAELAESRIPSDEIAVLRKEINRLKSITKVELPVGTGADYLASQIKPWFETVGYKFENHVVTTDDYFEWIINIQGRRGYDRILVRGVRGEADLGDIISTHDSVRQYNTDEGWLIAARRVSQAARLKCKEEESFKIICYTIDELLDESANFDNYLNWLEQEIKNRGVDTKYIPLNCTKEEYDSVTFEKIGMSTYNEENGGIDGYVDRWLDDPDKKHISILGEFGTGKSWFTLHYAWNALQRYRDAKMRGTLRPRIPLVIPLRDYAKAVSVESLFSEFFFRKHRIDLPNYGAFEQLNRMGKLLLIFDGFDEMAARVDRQSMVNNFWELAKVVKPGAKAILTCRTEHFPEAKEGRSLLNAELLASTSALTGDPPQFEVIELLKFNEKQIEQLLSIHATENTVELVMKNDKLLELVSRPVMIEFILDALPEINSGKPVDLSRIYLYAIQRKMNRDISEKRTFTSMADKMFFLCEVAWEMLSTDQMSLNYREFPQRIESYFGETVQSSKNLDHWHYDMMGQTMLIRNSEGDYSPAHRSLLEFFVAYKFASELGLLAEDFLEIIKSQSYIEETETSANYSWSNYFKRDINDSGETIKIAPLNSFILEDYKNLAMTFGHSPLSKAVTDLMINMVDSKKMFNLVEVILSTKSKVMDDIGYIGGNAATIISKLDKACLKRIDLSHTNLNNAFLHNADLVGCNFDFASLENINFMNANLHKASFKNTTLNGSNFIRANMKDSILDGAYMENVKIRSEGWLTAVEEKQGTIVFYYPKLSLDIERPPCNIPLRNDEIAIAKVENNEIVWIDKFNSNYIVEFDSDDDYVYILTLESELICYNLNSGEKVLKYFDSFLNWKDAQVRSTYGLNDYNKHLIKVLGGDIERIDYDTTQKRIRIPESEDSFALNDASLSIIK